MPASIDHLAYPHIISSILAASDRRGLDAFRRASRTSLALVEGEYARRVRHIVPRTMRGEGPPRVAFLPTLPCAPPLPALIASEIAAVAADPALGGLRARFSAIRVLDLGPEIDLQHFRGLRDLLDGITTVRLVGELRNPNHFPFAPRTVVASADLSRPEPFRGWHYQTRELVVNYSASEAQLLSLAFFPPSGCYGPRDLTLLFGRCEREVLARLPNGTRLGSRLLADLARVVCDGHRVTLVDWPRVGALFSPGTRPEHVDDTAVTWGGPPLSPPKVTRRRACLLKLASLALCPQDPDDSGPEFGLATVDFVRSLTGTEYAKALGRTVYADMTEGLGRDDTETARVRGWTK